MSDEKDVTGSGGKPFHSWPGLKLDNHERADHSSGAPEPTTYSDPEWWRGWTAGRLGLYSAEAKSIFQLDAERRRQEHVSSLQTDLTKAEAAAKIAAERHERAGGIANNVDDTYEKLETDRLKNPTGYSWPLGVFYCIVALILWIADLPLSLLAADGLGIRTDYRALQDLTVIRDQWQTMWEPLAFAIGIAALALFFKFVADFFFKPHYLERWWVRTLAAVLLLAVLLMVGGNLFLLARLRTGVRSLQEMQRQSATGVVPPGLEQQRQTMQEQANLSFVLLTLTLPLIGGICASAGWSRLQNSRRLATMTADRVKFRKEADETAETNSSTVAEVKRLNAALTAAEPSSTQAAEAAYALYLDGYRQGFAVPETLHNGRHMHERVQFILKQWLGVAQQRHSAARRAASEDVSGAPIPAHGVKST
jgi:cytochrome c biogenesis protein CcdA